MATTEASQQTKMTNNALLFLHAQTSLHPGSGTALGTVDLPVQRERHTQWPVIPGSSLKGVLRDACRESLRDQYEKTPDPERSARQRANEDDPQLVAAFGPGKVDESSSHAGAVAITDARILAFPVRSLHGVFAMVTCHSVLDRLRRDLHLAGISLPAVSAKPQDNSGDGIAEAICTPQSPLLLDGRDLILEEFQFHAQPVEALKALADELGGWALDEYSRPMFSERLVVLPDNSFSHFVRYATEVTARIGLNYETKTVRKGALFYQEFLPAETLFYSLVLAQPSRFTKDKATPAASAAELLGFVTKSTPDLLQIGGDETIGKGLCRAKYYLAGS